MPIPASMTDTLDAVAVTLKASQKFAVVRLRFPEPVPLRLFELAWLAGYVHAKSDVIVERLDTSIAETPAAAPSAPATPAAPPPVDHVKLEKVLMSTNVPDAVSAAGELADKQCVESIPALRIALDRASNGLVRGAAAKALGRMNDLDSVPVLIALLGLPNGDLAADADTALSLMSGLGRVLKSDTPVNQRLAVASRYAAWWKGAEANLRKKKAAAPGK